MDTYVWENQLTLLSCLDMDCQSQAKEILIGCIVSIKKNPFKFPFLVSFKVY